MKLQTALYRYTKIYCVEFHKERIISGYMIKFNWHWLQLDSELSDLGIETRISDLGLVIMHWRRELYAFNGPGKLTYLPVIDSNGFYFWILHSISCIIRAVGGGDGISYNLDSNEF